MAYAPHVVRVVARAIIAKSDMGLGTPKELVLAYPKAERQAILAEVYRIRPDLAQKKDGIRAEG